MGSARVQYELERTLPSLQLAATHGLFSEDVELRDITQKRRQYENALVRRHALVSDYLQYIQYEENLEKLRVLRVTRLKDLNRIPGSDMIKMQKEAISHIVSIFERGVKRLRYDLGLWLYYIRWAHKKKMRTVVSRVSARALALFPNKVELWLIVANYELNDYQGASTSRALLQRGLRLNSISHPWSIQMQARDRPMKKARRSEKGPEESIIPALQIIPSGKKEEDEATLILTDAEQDLVQIWIQYVRMELVFIERLRRRRIVLGISEESEMPSEDIVEATNEDIGAEEVPINDEGEVAPPSLKSMKQDIKINHQPSNALLQGAIPKATLRSAISLHSPSSLPPRAHFAFLLAMAGVVRTFPFCEDKGGLRSDLLREVHEITRSRFPSDPSVMLLLSTVSVLDHTLQSTLDTMSEVEVKEELQDGHLLKDASSLLPHSPSNKVIEKMFEEARRIARDAVIEKESIAFVYVTNMLKESLDRIKQTTEIASNMKTTLDCMRSMTMALESPSASHLSSQLRLIRFYQDLVESKDLGDALNQYLKACRKRVIQDARELHCEDLELERELCRGKLREVSLASKEKVSQARAVQIADSMRKACEKYPQDELLLLLYVQALVENSTYGCLSQEEGLKHWHRIQQHKVGKGSARVWKIWMDWIMAQQDKKGVISRLESSLFKTVSFPEAHEILLKGYLSTANNSSQDLQARIDHIEKRAYPQSSFWRWVIIEAKNLDISIEERIDLVKRIHTKLIQSDNKNDFKDYVAYLSFLMLEINDSSLGLQVFKEAQSRLSKDVSKRVALEQAWQKICQSSQE